MKDLKPLSLMLAGVGMLTIAGTGNAVNVSADGRGEVLIYPYYTTRADSLGSAYSTLMSVVNPSPIPRAVKVRFLEGRNGRPVIDFSLFLSPFDAWTAAVLPDLETGGAKIGTFDMSCTLPPFATSPTTPFIHFTNAAYAGPNDDGAGMTLDRTREGYFELIEMATYSSSSQTGIAVTHVNGTAPCGVSLNDGQAGADALPVAGGLFGATTLINVNSGVEYSIESIALANFYEIGPNYYPNGSPLPDLTSTSPPISLVYSPNGTHYQSFWTQGTADAVSAALMHDSILNEFTIDTQTKSGTDWVITMPTKRFYTRTGTGNGTQLFQRNFNGNSGSCDDVVLNMWDRESRMQTGPLNFTPAPPTGGPSICWTANVITFNNTNVLGSLNRANVQTPGFQNGWMTVTFPTGIAAATPGVHQLVNRGFTSITPPGAGTSSGNTTTFNGLPVIGFAVISFSNGTLVVGDPPAAVLSNYGGDFKHKSNTTIQ